MIDSDYDSDGSDYDPHKEGSEALEEEDDNVEFRSSDTSLVRVGRHDVVIQDVPIPKDYCADPCQISVAQLEDQIRYHILKGTLNDALTKVDIASKVFSNPRYPPREIQLGKDRYPPRETRYQVIQKTYGTPFHYACHDPNGNRGEQKIRLLLLVADHYKVPVSRILFPSEVTVRKYGNQWHEVAVDGKRERMESWSGQMHQTTATPLYILLDNPHSSIKAIRLLVEAWPAIVHMQYFTERNTITEYHNSLSHVLLLDPASPNRIKEDGSRVLAIAKTLLEVAAKTHFGAKGLIAANTQDHLEGVESSNAILVALSHGSCLPLEILTQMLQRWPEAVQESGNGSNSDRFCPLYSILCHNPQITKSCLWQAKCIEAILRYSSLESIVIGLVRTDDIGRPQFQGVLQITNQLKLLGETERVERLLEAFNAIISKRDEQGKTILHHVVVAPEFRSAPPPPEHDKSMASASKRRRKYYQEANCHMELVQWILEKDPAQPWVRDIHGENALHAALNSGGTWNSGVQAMIELVPDWQYEPMKRNGEKDDLLPFQIAATAVDRISGAVDTIYELLKITGPRAFSDIVTYEENCHSK